MTKTRFHSKLDIAFPDAVLEEDFVRLAAAALNSAGFTRTNSIACVMVCRDEMCSPFVKEVTLHFGECFDMRGLGGFISCGNTGFGAAHGHSPIVGDRRRFVYFVAPHIAIDGSGSVRNVERAGIKSKSTACGALCQFEKELKDRTLRVEFDDTDVEQSMLRQALASRLTRGAGYRVDDLLELTKLAERVIVEDQLQTLINATVDTSKADYAIVAGVQIHGPGGKTYFHRVAEHCITCIGGRVAPLVTSRKVNVPAAIKRPSSARDEDAQHDKSWPSRGKREQAQYLVAPAVGAVAGCALFLALGGTTTT